MKKTLLTVFIVALVVAGVSDAWAMGRKGHGGSGQIVQHHYDEGRDAGHQSSNSASNPDDVSNDQQDQESFARFAHPNNDEGFPAATTVPEPATLALMGMGLGGLLLRKKR